MRFCLQRKERKEPLTQLKGMLTVYQRRDYLSEFIKKYYIYPVGYIKTFFKAYRSISKELQLVIGNV